MGASETEKKRWQHRFRLCRSELSLGFIFTRRNGAFKILDRLKADTIVLLLWPFYGREEFFLLNVFIPAVSRSQSE